MTNALEHRGPDGEGFWIEGGVGLGHRRLSIIDVSPRSAQPMISADEQFVVVYNGEIYNYIELRRSLEAQGVAFRTEGDTEVLLALYEQKGEAMLEDLRGMFAFAIWDRYERTLFCARDRLGKKPFYYRRVGEAFAFASEIAPLRVLERVTLDEQAVVMFLGLQYVPAPLTGYQEIQSLPAGHTLWVREGRETVQSYEQVWHQPAFEGTYRDAVKKTQFLLQESVKMRLRSDVPVGVLLSGGIDSSAVAAYASRATGVPLRTYTLGVDDPRFDERKEAHAYARELGAEHTECVVSEADVLEAVDATLDMYGMPFADASAVLTRLVCARVREDVKVVLTGDGGDEAFGGYRRHQYAWRAQMIARWLGTDRAHRYGMTFAHLLKREDVRRLALACAEAHGADRYAQAFESAYFDRAWRERLLHPAVRERTRVDASSALFESAFAHTADERQGILRFDRTSYLPDCLNVKMDRASMNVGLEARAPFQDQEIVRFCASLPSDWLFTARQGKILLRDALRDVLPADILRRKKRGFQAPLDAWFRGPLREAFEAQCLSGEAFHGMLQASEIQRVFKEHQHGASHGNRLWMLYSLARWMKHV